MHTLAHCLKCTLWIFKVKMTLFLIVTLNFNAALPGCLTHCLKCTLWHNLNFSKRKILFFIIIPKPQGSFHNLFSQTALPSNSPYPFFKATKQRFSGFSSRPLSQRKVWYNSKCAWLSLTALPSHPPKPVSLAPLQATENKSNHFIWVFFLAALPKKSVT